MTPLQQSAKKAAVFASQMDFRLLAVATERATDEERDAHLYRGFRQFIGLLNHMRELKAQAPELYAKAEADAVTAREIEGQAG